MEYTASPAADLIRACAEGETAAWHEFMRRFHRIITITAYRVARRWSAASPALVDDLAQETYLKLCAGGGRVLAEFDSSDPDAILAFLRVVTTNVANDYFKRLHAGKRGGAQATESLDDLKHADTPVSAAGSDRIERTMLLQEVDACLSAVAPAETRDRDCVIFWLYYRQGLTAKEIAELPAIGLGLKGVESTLHRLTQLVRSQLVERGSAPAGRGGK
jgi:RNA polymerase sigma-70 factor (ECF subfamily)